MDGRELLFKLSDSCAVSGYEMRLHPILKSYFEEYVDKISFGNLGDLIALKKGDGKFKILITAHADEVGLMVMGIDDRGFIQFTQIEGVDPKTLPAQEVMIHGKKEIYGVIGAKPPHVLSKEDRKKAAKIEDMLIDTGLPYDEVKKYISVGDFITVKRNCKELLNGFISGKALDDRAGICALYECAKILKERKHTPDVYFAVTTMEEVGHKGAKVTSYDINPDLAIAIDVTSADRYLDSEISPDCGKNIRFAVGPNLHPELTQKLMDTADKAKIPFVITVEPDRTGTDAWDMNVSRSGIPVALISVPLRYMHTSSEVINYSDVEKLGRLLAEFICSINDWSDIYA